MKVVVRRVMIAAALQVGAARCASDAENSAVFVSDSAKQRADLLLVERTQGVYAYLVAHDGAVLPITPGMDAAALGEAAAQRNVAGGDVFVYSESAGLRQVSPDHIDQLLGTSACDTQTAVCSSSQAIWGELATKGLPLAAEFFASAAGKVAAWFGKHPEVIAEGAEVVAKTASTVATEAVEASAKAAAEPVKKGAFSKLSTAFNWLMTGAVVAGSANGAGEPEAQAPAEPHSGGPSGNAPGAGTEGGQVRPFHMNPTLQAIIGGPTQPLTDGAGGPRLDYAALRRFGNIFRLTAAPRPAF